MVLSAANMAELDRLDGELKMTSVLTPELLHKVIERAGGRLSSIRQSEGLNRLDRLIEADAWTDAVFALVELEAPAWKLWRLTCEGGEWLCSLSRRLNLSATLDDMADGSHEVLALAILRAFVEAQYKSRALSATSAVPQIRPMSDQMVCCDNFA